MNSINRQTVRPRRLADRVHKIVVEREWVNPVRLSIGGQTSTAELNFGLAAIPHGASSYSNVEINFGLFAMAHGAVSYSNVEINFGLAAIPHGAGLMQRATQKKIRVRQKRAG